MIWLGTTLKKASERLSSTTDTDFKAVVDRLFKKGAKNEDIRGPLADIASWVEVEQKATAFKTLKPADVRFFCGNDKSTTGDADPRSDARRKKKNKPSTTRTYYDIKKFLVLAQDSSYSLAAMASESYLRRAPFHI